MTKKHIVTALLFMVLVFQTGCANSGDVPIPNGETQKTAATKQNTEPEKQSTPVLSGKIEAIQSANLVSKVAGKVAAVHVDIGSTVKAGQLLVSLSAEDKAAEFEEAVTLVEKAQVDADLALKTYQRGKELMASQAISQADYDNLYEGPYKKAEVGLKTAQASLKRKQIAYDDMFIKAPFAGVITAKNINPGEMAGTQTAVLSLVNLSQVVIKASVGENQINQLKNDQAVEVKVPAIPGKTFSGKINNIALATDPQTKAYPVKIQLDNSDNVLKPGMFAEIVLNK
ncbi:efflux RND transporter periplasmic adaptor subunit [Desulfotomaculum sp. 1211_IL3151]|uniref:efflux RND transporter periplasmic adaptor subunit n=1 Tax=Desulfotomaculum sp. 1211_IL3151 TaxID=3084055 RepID=UPI002FDA5BC1